MHKEHTVENLSEKKEIDRKQMVEVIIDKLFKKIKEKSPANDKTNLNLCSADGLSFDACQRYTDDQYFVDVTFMDYVKIEGLFFDKRKLEIGGFGSEGKPLTQGLVKRLYDNIEKITQDYNVLELLNDTYKGRVEPPSYKPF